MIVTYDHKGSLQKIIQWQTDCCSLSAHIWHFIENTDVQNLSPGKTIKILNKCKLQIGIVVFNLRFSGTYLKCTSCFILRLAWIIFSSCKGHLMRYLLPKNMEYEGANWPNITKYLSKHVPGFISTVLMYLLVLVSLLFAAVWSWNPSLPLIWHAIFIFSWDPSGCMLFATF